MDDHDIIEKWGLPRGLVTCPSCGQLYGHHNTTVCLHCEECSTCCGKRLREMNATRLAARAHRLVDADTFVKKHVME